MSCGRDGEDEETMPGAPSLPSSTLCVKCRVLPVAVVRYNAAYCLDCFVGSIIKRFKDVMHPARLYCRAPKRGMENASALLAFSGSTASRAILDLLQTHYLPQFGVGSRDAPAFRKLDVVYVTCGDDRDNDIQEMRAFVESYGSELTIVPVEEIYESSTLSASLETKDLRIHEDTSSATPLSLSTSFTPASRQTLSSSTLTAYLAQYAQSKGHKALIMGESATKLASNTLAAMSKGQGWSLGEMVAGSNVPVLGSDVRIFRPLSNVSRDEVLFYGSEAKQWPELKATSQKPGIDGLLDTFINNLEANFPSTVSVIGRTAGKLGLRSHDAEAAKIVCPICLLPADTDARKWREAASLSSLIQPETTQDSNGSSHSGLADMLCYGCLVPFTELQASMKGGKTEQTKLPAYSQKVIQQRKTDRETMRAQIEEFLI